MQKDDLLRGLEGLPIPEIRFFDSIHSTNDVGLAWAEAGGVDGSLVVADQQTRGRGRLGRPWITHPGSALAFTLILRPTPGEREHLGLFSPLAGLAVCLVLQGMGLPAQIKWPNDVLLSQRKTCGILAESSWQEDQLQGVVVGVGINIAPDSVPSVDQVQFPATCVEENFGHSVNRIQLLRNILEEFFTWRGELGSAAFIDAWEVRLAFKGQAVNLLQSGRENLNGILLGVDPQGSLRIQLPDGSVKLVSVGDVHLRPFAGSEGSGR